MRIQTIFMTIAGLFLLLLGAIGVFLPVWPTTPFVLAGAACLTGTPKLRGVILRVPLFREHIENYKNRTGLPRAIVVRSLLYLWGMLLLSMFFVRRPWVIALEALVGVCVTLHILWIAKPKEGRKR